MIASMENPVGSLVWRFLRFLCALLLLAFIARVLLDAWFMRLELELIWRECRWSVGIGLVLGFLAGLHEAGKPGSDRFPAIFIMSNMTYGFIAGAGYGMASLIVDWREAALVGALPGLLYGIKYHADWADADFLKPHDLESRFRGLPHLFPVMGAGATGASVLHADVPIQDGFIFGAAAAAGLTVTFLLITSPLPSYLLDAVATLAIAQAARWVPAWQERLALWLPHLHCAQSIIPLPGLVGFLSKLSAQNPELARDIMKMDSALFSRVIEDLKAFDLERAAREGNFAAVVALDLPFVQENPAGLRPDDPLRPFQLAAREVQRARSGEVAPNLAIGHALEILAEFAPRTRVSSLRYGPLTRRLRSTVRLWSERIQHEETRLTTGASRIPVPFVAGPSLFQSTTFQGRTDLLCLIQEHMRQDQRRPLLIFGQHRIGKSSLLHAMQEHLGPDVQVAILSARQPAGGTPEERIADLVGELRGRPSPTGKHVVDAPGWRWRSWLAGLWRRERNAAPRPRPSHADVQQALVELDGQMDRDSRRLLIALDEMIETVPPESRAAFASFLCTASEMLKRIRFLVVNSSWPRGIWPDQRGEIPMHKVSYLDQAAARQLILRPGPGFPDIYPEWSVDRILELTRCHPYWIQYFCMNLCHRLNEAGRDRATEEDLEAVLLQVLCGNQLQLLWNERTSREREVLLRLANGSGHVFDGHESIVQDLLREEYVERVQGNLTVALPLFKLWIQRIRLDSTGPNRRIQN